MPIRVFCGTQEEEVCEAVGAIAALTAGVRNHRWQLSSRRPMIQITDAHRPTF